MKAKYLNIFVLALIFLFCFCNLCLGYSELTLPVWKENSLITTNVSSNNVSTFESNIESKAACLIDQATGQILYEYNSHEQLRPASVTKVMTILLIMEAVDSGKISLEDQVPCSENANKMGGSQIWLDTTETLTVNEMLKAICVVSANDCTVAMAEFLAGSQESFVQRMNDKAKALGMNDTTFKNCHGLDEDGHVTSAYDIALMSRELITNHPNITNYTTIWMDNLRDGKSQLVNTNKLVRNYSGCTGLKTGSTSLALYNLSASATRDNLSLISVIMGGPTSQIRFDEAKSLLDYGFANYSSKKLAVKDEILTQIPVIKGTKEQISIGYESDLAILSSKGSEDDIETIVNIPENILAPVHEGDKTGEVIFRKNGEEVGKVNIVSLETSEKLNLGNMMKITYDSWFNLLRK